MGKLGTKIKTGKGTGKYIAQNGNLVDVTWGDKIRKTQRSTEFQKTQRRKTKCRNCGKTFMGYRSVAKYCSRKCSYDFLKKDQIRYGGINFLNLVL